MTETKMAAALASPTLHTVSPQEGTMKAVSTLMCDWSAFYAVFDIDPNQILKEMEAVSTLQEQLPGLQSLTFSDSAEVFESIPDPETFDIDEEGEEGATCSRHVMSTTATWSVCRQHGGDEMSTNVWLGKEQVIKLCASPEDIMYCDMCWDYLELEPER